MMAYLAAILLASQGVLVCLMLREHRHALEVIESVAKSGSPDLRELIGLVDRLCQRVQAPGYAVAEHAQHAMTQDAPQAVSMFDDEEHWASKEDLAEALSNGRS